MTTPNDAEEPADLSSVPPEVLRQVKQMVSREYAKDLRNQLGSVPRSIDWTRLSPEDLEHELLELNRFVDWLRHTYGLPPQIIPPMWHRHPELLWELSALRQQWLTCFDAQAKGNMGIVFHAEFAAARERLRDWVTISGTRLDRDRATRITAWPGGEADGFTPPDSTEYPVENRTEDFVSFVEEQVLERQRAQDAEVQEIVNSEWSDQP
ncbi:hypothetical protein [Brevibacterium aurantiacum]|uniref:DUF4913 domain-containing protein n=1 Tax=Brevibacterium aurantiacum TaxID=273384 RepID=A0A2H1K2E7_BREAU|nr:hypothetical protein [Brevibacterium aurantiacum]AZT97640.1 hypothetical protein CXR27_11990 [Brevibacterium aurantiacum]SMX93724.1 hypothetical protein BAURA63_02874 [Brevibacterium aurantiacum]